MEKPFFTEGMLIRCQSYDGDYACTLSRVTMSGGDGMNSNTQVPATRHVWGLWACSVVLDNKCCQSRVGEGGVPGRQVVKSCLPTSYCNEEKVMVLITPGFSSF
jgi:hypothetical protein